MARVAPKGGTGDSVFRPRLADVKGLWDIWEIHCLILLSLFLQAFLFLFADMRQRSSSSILRIVLWLAYLSADSVAIFVLGHLVVHAEGPRHHLMYFWAPFVLVHLGGQDTITAFSKQDNELWRRHLLNLVTQVAVAGYVVAKASWPDRRLLAAMVLMFLSGCFKYAERTFCLYNSSPQFLRSTESVPGMLRMLRMLDDEEGKNETVVHFRNEMIGRLDMMSKGVDTTSSQVFYDMLDAIELLSEDAPCSTVETILIADDVPGILVKFKSRAGRCRAYEYVGATLARCYQMLHTKVPLREYLYRFVWRFMRYTCDSENHILHFKDTLILLSVIFQHVSSPIALVLFMAAEKGDQHHTSRVDIKVSYILLVGAVILDACSFFSSLRYLPDGWIRSAVLRVANCIQPAWSRKQWSEELAQYNMIRQEFGNSLAARLFGLGTITQTKYHTPMKVVILDHLLCLGTRKEWDITSSRGKLALQKWRDRHQQDPDYSSRAGKALENSIGVDFPISVLVWHIATDMCYYHGDNSTNGTVDHMNWDVRDNKQVSRELSNYVMYLVFKCGVKRTTGSQFVHDTAQEQIREIFRKKCQQVNRNEKDAVWELFEHMAEEQQHPPADEVQKPEEQGNNNNLQKLVQGTLEALDSPVLPRAREVARELIGIKDAAERWRLIVEVWSEMLYYAAPRCGGAFHYEHLSTGGEFVTQVLFLMWFLGPFLPPPGA